MSKDTPKFTEAQVRETFKKLGITYSDVRNEKIGVQMAMETLNDPLRVKGDLARSARITAEQEDKVTKQLFGNGKVSLMEDFRSAVSGALDTAETTIKNVMDGVKELGASPKGATEKCEALAKDYESGKSVPTGLAHCISSKM